MSQPTQFTVTYISSPPNTTATQVVVLSKPDGVTATEPTLAARNIFLAGGFAFTDASGAFVFIPASMIVKITGA